MNSSLSAPVPGTSNPSRRRPWLLVFAVAFVALAGLWMVKHRIDKARATAERRQFLRMQEAMLEQMAHPTTPAGPIRSGPVWVESKGLSSTRTHSQDEGTSKSEILPLTIPALVATTTPVKLPPSEPTSTTPSGQSSTPPVKARKNRGEDLFDTCVVPTLVIEVPRSGVAALGANPRRYVTATVREGDIRYTNVALKLKGGPGSFRNFEDTPSLTLNFEKFAEGQSFHGLKKLHLNSSIQDRTFLCEKISRELFNAAGIPTPRAGHALVTLNGREMGLHVLLEGVNRQFLKRHFEDPSGNVYDGHAGMDVGTRIPVNEGENPKDRQRLADLAAAAKESDLNTRRERLEKVLDVDRFLTFVGLETLLAHWDGYTMNRNNYRIFHDRASDRMVFLPHGMDQVLGGREVALFPKSQAIVARSVLEVPEFRARYRSRLRELATNVFQPTAIAGRVREIVSRVGPVLATEDIEAASAFRRRASSFEKRIAARSISVERELFGAPVLASRTTHGAPEVTEWEPRLDLGDATLERVQDERGRAVLRVTTSKGCTASWRSRAVLEPGRYRLEGDLRFQGVELDSADPRSGAGFRISRQRTGQKNTGNREWSAVRHDFEVSETMLDVELICELRAKKGVLWVDPESIKLTRLAR